MKSSPVTISAWLIITIHLWGATDFFIPPMLERAKLHLQFDRLGMGSMVEPLLQKEMHDAFFWRCSWAVFSLAGAACGWAVLRRRKWSRHVWLAFAVAWCAETMGHAWLSHDWSFGVFVVLVFRALFAVYIYESLFNSRALEEFTPSSSPPAAGRPHAATDSEW